MYRWYREEDGGLQAVQNTSMITALPGTLTIGSVDPEMDPGKYVCVANNSLGSDSAPAQLNVLRPLEPKIYPESQTVDTGRPAMLSCNGTGLGAEILWLKNGRPLTGHSGERQIYIQAVGTEHAGMYQCLVTRPGGDQAQATAELRLGVHHSCAENLQNKSSINIRKTNKYANPPAGAKDANSATSVGSAFKSPFNGVIEAQRTWANSSEDVNPASENGFTVVKGKKRRRGSAESPEAAAHSSNARRSGTNHRQRTSTERVPRAQEIKTTRTHIVEARARQASSTEEHCLYIEHCPELEPYHYLKAIDEMVGGTSDVVQIAKVNGHLLLGLSNKTLAERLINEGLEVEGMSLKTFPFYRRAARITISNLPFFVKDASVIDALLPYGRITSIVPKQLKAGKYVYTDGRREASIVPHDGINIESLPARLDIRIKGEAWPMYLTSGIRCSRCQGQGHRRANCPLLHGQSTTSRRASPPSTTNLPPLTAHGLPGQSSAAPTAPAPPSPALGTSGAPPDARIASLPSTAPRPSTPALPASFVQVAAPAPPPEAPAPEHPASPRSAATEPTPPARPNFTAPYGPLPAHGTFGPATHIPDVDMTTTEETSAFSSAAVIPTLPLPAPRPAGDTARMSSSASPGSSGSAEQEPGRPSIPAPTGGRKSSENGNQKIILKENSENRVYANPPAGVKDVNLAAARDVTLNLPAGTSSNGAARVLGNWADCIEDLSPGAEDDFNVVKTKKRRRESSNLPTAAAPSSNSGGARSSLRLHSSARSVPRAQEIPTTRTHITEARARQASSSEEHCVYLEHGPELQPFHYLRALDRLLGGTAGIIQISKVNGHQLLGLANRGLAERLINNGLEVEGTLLRAFPFRKRAERITVGNLPFFVEDSAIIKALGPYGRITSIAPKMMKAGPYTYTDGRREAFIVLHEGVTTERLPTRLNITIKGEAWPAYLSSGIKCSRCHGQGHRRANCPLLAGRTTAPGPATPTSPTSVPPATAPRVPQQPSNQPPPPASPSSTMEVSDVPPTSRAALHPPAALRQSPPAPSALPAEDALPALPPVTPAPSLRTPGSCEPAAPTPDVEMSIVEETSASSASSAKNATRVDLDAFIEKHPSVSFAGTDSLGLGREE
ncbi:Dscam, partial [Cordylochernes scorpioides]